MCKDCYGKGVIHQINGFTGVTTIEPCHCLEIKPHEKWMSDLIQGIADYNGLSVDQVKRELGV